MKNMRNQIFALVVLITGTLSFTACNKKAEEIQALVSNSEATEILETMITERTAGLTMPTVDMAAILETVENNCGVAGDTTYSLTKTLGAATYNRNFSLNWLINCNQLNIPEDATFKVTGAGTFAGVNWTGETACTGDMAFTGLSGQATEYSASGSYLYTGTLTGDLRRTDPSVTCEADLSLTNLRISKTTNQITAGTGTATLKATATSGETITVTASIVFNGNGSVTVNVNGRERTFEQN